MSARHATIDISAVARPFRYVRFANYFMVVGCGTWLIGQVVNATNVTLEWIPISLFLWVALAVNFWAGLKTAGRIDGLLWPRLYWSLPLLILACSLAARSLYVSMPADIVAETNPAGNAIFVATVLSSVMAVSGALGLAAVIVLDRSRIGTFGLTPRQLLAATSSFAVEPVGTAPVGLVNRLLGTTFYALAAAVLIGQHFVPDEIWQPNAWALSAAALSGWAFLFHARRYFQPDARALLASDGRDPVLFLRSFLDDEKKRYLTSELSVIDFGLETRLATHFAPFGPFVGIGSPQDPTPRPGAATAKLKDGEWRSVVKDWMARARYIILLAGTTEGVTWELEQVVTNGHVPKLVILIPRSDFWNSARREADARARLETTAGVLSKTAWASSLDGIARPQDVRAVVLRNDGTATLVTSRPRNRDSYHVAALVAQYLLLRQPRTSP